MVAILEVKKWETYERRLEACLEARNRCEEDSWGWNYWQEQFTVLLRRMNWELNTNAGVHRSLHG